ncbi:MAG: O-antigen ligase family protein [Acidobacteria bacterium]|nr:O-antigen ligase family protein [Acidobacteriota bacterium]
MQNERENSELAEAAGEAMPAAEPSRFNGAGFFLLCVILVFSVVAYGAVDTWAFGFISILTGLMVLCRLAESWIAGRLEVGTSPLLLPLGGLILIGLVQLLPLRSANLEDGLLSIPAVASLSINPYATRLMVAQLILYTIFFGASFVYLNRPKRLRKIVALVVIFGAVMAFFGILQRIANPEGIYGLRPTPQSIPFGSFVNQHHFAAFMEMTAALTLALLVGQATAKDKRLLLIIALVLMTLAILLTGSRGGLLSLFGVVAFVFLANFLRRERSGEDVAKSEKHARFRRNLAILGGGLAIVLLLVSAVVMLGGDASLMRGVGLANQADISSGRTHFWAVAWQIFKDYPILGAGLDAFGTAFPRYDTWNGTLRVEQAHNDYLQTLADAGILGLITVGSFIFLLFRQGLRRIGGEHSHFGQSAAIGGLAGCFGILIHSFFDFPLRTSSNGFYFLLFAVLATAPVVFPHHHHRKK